MPDHLHAIIVLVPAPIIGSTQWVDATRFSGGDRAIGDDPDPSNVVSSRPNGSKPGSLGAIIGAFKSVTAKHINAINGQTGVSFWQDGFYDRVIRRNGGEFERISQYIAENPAKWI